MKRSIYKQQDYAFGQLMLSLRMRIGLTQAGLAERLHVSRHTVVEWENGRSYPNVDHLKHVIYLGIQRRAFEEGHEATEISQLWQAAHQKVFMDEEWLQAVLNEGGPLFSRASDAVVEAAREPRIDWDSAPIAPSFYGREQELARLSHRVLEERCRVVGILGAGGIGKSALAVNFMRMVASHFEVAIWCSLRDAPACEAVLEQCLQALDPRALLQVSGSLAERLDLLLELLRSRRALIVLDNLETLLLEGSIPGLMRPGYEGYDQLLRRVTETEHQSCLLFTSREQAREIFVQERNQPSLWTLRLGALDENACIQLLTAKKIAGSSIEYSQLIETYAGNPLVLNVVAQTITDLFAGEVAPFLEQGKVLFSDIRELLHKQFARLSLIEQTVFLWLAIAREPISIAYVQTLMVMPCTRAQVLEAFEALLNRSLIERGQCAGTFTLQSVVLEYVTEQFLRVVANEIESGHLHRFVEHSLELATAKEYIRQNQQRLIVAPLLAYARYKYPGCDDVEKHLLMLLGSLRTLSSSTQGYGPANILALLKTLRGHLRGLDLSQLAIRGALLQNVEMQDASLAGAILYDTVFTDSFDAIRAIDISADGRFWVTGSRRGDTQVWSQDGKVLHQAWQAHTDTVRDLELSPDGKVLATGSWDGAIKLWDPERGTLLWADWLPTKIQRVCFAPNGKTLVSAGNDALIRFWDTASGQQRMMLSRQRSPVEALAWSPDGYLLASGGHDGSIRIWERPEEHPDAPGLELAGHSAWVTGLAFAPDGSMLVSGSVDGTVRLWELASGRCLQTLTGHAKPVFAVAWSPDGQLLASSGQGFILLWDIKRECYRAALHEQGAGVYEIAFTPDSRYLLGGGDDGSLRLWDTEHGQCVQNQQSYALSIYDVSWSPDGEKIASADTDTTVTIWETERHEQPRVLCGHRWVVHGVMWSPDGRTLASCGWDNMIRLWDVATGAEIQTLQDPDLSDALFAIFGLDWSPDGKFLAVAYTFRGVQIWEVNTGVRRWIGQTDTAVTRVAWSPDGRRLASCSDAGKVCVWDATNGVLQRQLVGHHGMVKSVAWNPDGRRLASGSVNHTQGGDSGELYVWDANNGARLHAFVGYSGVVSALAWTEDGKKIVSGGSDGMLRWWDIESEECFRVRKAHQGAIQSLKVSPNGALLASCGDDSAIHIWDLDSGELLHTYRRDRPYERLDISGVKGLTPAQQESLHMLGAI